MWQCGACEYWNDEWDETCRNCNAGRISKDQPDTGVVEPDREKTASAKAPDGDRADHPRKRLGTLETVIIAVIVICVGALGFLGYMLLKKEGGGPQLKLPEVQLPALPESIKPADGFDPRAEAIDTGHGLAALYTAELRDVKQLYPFADTLIATEYALETIPAAQAGEGGPDLTGLEQIRILADNLVESFEAFEQKYIELNNPDLESYALLLRSNYAIMFDNLLAAVGEFYIADDAGVHEAYLLSDQLPDLVEKYDSELALRLIQRWNSVNFDRSQRLLDEQFETEISELNGWVEAVLIMHRGFEAESSKVDPYVMRNGILDSAAKETLDLLDGLMTDIELLTAGFVEYEAGLGDHGRSNRIKHLCRQFTDTAQADHLYAFEEIYRIYALDRSLKYPVYDLLKGHYDFAVSTWPNKEVAYRGVYTKYETEWVERWAQ